MANNANDNAQYVRDLVEQRGLTAEIEAQALLVIEMQQQLEEM